MANQRVLILRYDSSQIFSIPVTIPTAYSELSKQLELRFRRPLQHFLVLIESSSKIVATAKDLESALRDSIEPNLVLKVRKKRRAERQSDSKVANSHSRSGAVPIHISQTLEINSDTDLFLLATHVRDYTSNPAFARLLLRREMLTPAETDTIMGLVREGTHLRELSILGGDWSDEAWTGVLKAAMSRATLKVMKLEAVSIAGKRVESLRLGLSGLANLEVLEVGEIHISATDMASVFSALLRKASFRHLSFRNTPLYQFAPLLPVILRLTSLEILECVDCGLESSDLIPLLPVLASLPLIQLNFSHNRLGSDLCPSLASFLASHATLIMVVLNGNQISEDGMKILQRALSESSTHLRVSLTGNPLSRESMESLVRASGGALVFTDPLESDPQLDTRCSCKCSLF